MRRKPFQTGDPVVYRKTKHTPQPGPRAHSISPAANGDNYVYLVDKFWVVSDVRDDGRLVLKTRGGKQHIVSPDDPNLRPAGLWTRYRFGDRFPAMQSQHHQSH